MKRLLVFVVLLAALGCSDGGKGPASSQPSTQPLGSAATIELPTHAHGPFCRGRSQLQQALAVSPPHFVTVQIAIASFEEAIRSITGTTPAETAVKNQLLAVKASLRIVELQTTSTDPAELADAIAQTEQLLSPFAVSC